MATRFGETLPVMKLTMLMFEALAIWAVLALLAARGLPSALVLPIAWHPLAVWEVAGSGHIDIVAIGVDDGGAPRRRARQQGAAGIVLGLAAAPNSFPWSSRPRSGAGGAGKCRFSWP